MATNFNRRADWHDYRKKSTYMITFKGNRSFIPFSSLYAQGSGADLKVMTRFTPSGLAIYRALQEIPKICPLIDLCNFTIMPDHIHFLIRVREYLDRHLGIYLKELKTRCRENMPVSTSINTNESLFEDGYNDRIMLRPGQYERTKQYIWDNPKRLYIRQQYPDFYRRNDSVRIGDSLYSVYGNIHLLQEPLMAPVRVSSRFSPSEKAERERITTETIRSQGVLISPFISETEKTIRDRGIENGCRIIRIQNNGFPERFKPTKAEFELCEQGRLLIIAPSQFRSQNPDQISRSECLAMNELAEAIAFGKELLRAKLLNG